MKNISLTYATIYLTISSFLFIISAYIINIFMGRHLGPVDYGTYGIVISLMTSINLVQVSGLPQALSKFIAEDSNRAEETLKSGLNLQVISTLVITIFFLLSAKTFSLLLKDPSLVPYIQTASLIFPFYGIFALYTGYYNGLRNFKLQALINIIYSITKTIAVIIFALVFHLHGAFVGFIVAPFFALIFGFHLPKFTRNIFPYKKLILFSLPLIGFAFLSTLLQSIDLYFVKALLTSDKIVGYYTANQNISRIPFFALSAFASILFPSISRNIRLNLHEKSRTIIRDSLRIIILLLTPLTLTISATSSDLLQLLFSKTYLPGSSSLSILIFGIGFLTIFIILANILNGAGHPKKSLIISGVGVLTTSVFCLILIPRIGLNGAATSTTIGSFVVMIITAIFVYKQFNALISITSIARILASSIVIYLLALVIKLPVIFLPLTYIFLFCAYILSLILLKEITSKDWSRFKELIPRWVPFYKNL